MHQKSPFFLILNLKASEYFEIFLIAAVTTILGVRFFLDISGYPQIGGGGLHIAHMLWGGLLMLSAIFLLLTCINNFIFLLSALVGGIGFGLFIDELGKFITSDNNYFFEPTFALIYIIFILLFLAFRFLEKKHKYSDREYTANAFDLVRQLVTEKYDPKVSHQALKLIQSGKISSTASKPLFDMIVNLDAEYLHGQVSQTNLVERLSLLYEKIVAQNWFRRTMIVFFTIFTLYNLWKGIEVISLYFRLQEFNLSFTELGKFISSIFSSILISVGIIYSLISQQKGYKVLKCGFLFSIFVTQFFDFYDNQLAAAGFFFLNIFCLFVLNKIIHLTENTQIPAEINYG